MRLIGSVRTAIRTTSAPQIFGKQGRGFAKRAEIDEDAQESSKLTQLVSAVRFGHLQSQLYILACCKFWADTFKDPSAHRRACNTCSLMLVDSIITCIYITGL